MLVSDPVYPRLKDFLLESSGLAYYADKDSDLAERISRRLGTVGLSDCAAYLELLQDGPAGEAEFDAVIAELTIGETYFFRHREQFEAIRDILIPDVIGRKKDSKRLRIWSAGCATGAEAYSIAILLKEELSHQLAGWDVSILGTDINREFLALAAAGKYEEWAFRSCPEDLKRRCFSPSAKSWVIAPEFKKCVSFQHHNLVKHAFPSLLHNLAAFDLILCRNVMIYFSAEIIRKLVGQFERSLVEGGWLLVGHSEPNVEFFQSFRTLNRPGATLYQRIGEPEGGALSAAISLQPKRPSTSLEKGLPTWRATSPSPKVDFEKRTAISAVTPTRAKLEQVEAIKPELASIRRLANQGRWDTAARSCEELLQREKLNAVAQFYYALVLEQIGQHAETERSLRRAIYLDRNFILAHYCLGLCLQKKGDATGAARCFRNVLKLLSPLEPSHLFVEGDGVTASELSEITTMHLEALQGS